MITHITGEILLVLNKNPLVNIDNIQTLDFVINKGTIIDLPLVIPTPEELVQQQLNAYNGHDLEAFLAVFAEDVKVYVDNEFKYQGKKDNFVKIFTCYSICLL